MLHSIYARLRNYEIGSFFLRWCKKRKIMGHFDASIFFFVKDIGFVNLVYNRQTLYSIQKLGAQWLSRRVLDSRPRGCMLEPHRCHCVVFLSKIHWSLLSTGSTQDDLSRHNWKVVDWEVKNQIKQIIQKAPGDQSPAVVKSNMFLKGYPLQAKNAPKNWNRVCIFPGPD